MMRENISTNTTCRSLLSWMRTTPDWLCKIYLFIVILIIKSCPFAASVCKRQKKQKLHNSYLREHWKMRMERRGSWGRGPHGPPWLDMDVTGIPTPSPFWFIWPRGTWPSAVSPISKTEHNAPTGRGRGVWEAVKTRLGYNVTSHIPATVWRLSSTRRCCRKNKKYHTTDHHLKMLLWEKVPALVRP